MARDLAKGLRAQNLISLRRFPIATDQHDNPRSPDRSNS